VISYFGWFQPHTGHVTMFRTWMGHYTGIPTSQIGACICTVPTAGPVATGEVNCYIEPTHSPVWQRWSAWHNDPWVARMFITCGLGSYLYSYEYMATDSGGCA